MKHIVSFSGGMGSFAEAKSCVDKYGKENVLLLFADTKMEDPDLYRFLKETHEFLGCELVTIFDGRTPWELFKDDRFIANSVLDSCSDKLKRKLMLSWVKENYGYTATVPLKRSNGEYIKDISGKTLTKEITLISAEVHLGIDYSESHRIEKAAKSMLPWIYRSTLVEEGRIIPKDYSEQFGIKRPFLYTLGFGHNNCGGFCVKAGLGQFKMLYENLPERYKYHEEKEQEVLALGGLPFLKKTTNKKVRYISMKEYREEFLETPGAEEDKYDIGGCACALPTGLDDD